MSSSSRRTFLKCVAVLLPLSGCASIPPDLTRRNGAPGDAASLPPDPWRPEKSGPTTEASPPADASNGDTFYVCPMHPDVTHRSAGTCPKCSMALVRKKKGASQ